MEAMKIIKANIWGAQKNVYLTDWQNIKSLGFEPRDRAFGTLNDGTQALFFYSNILYDRGMSSERSDEWYVTTENMSQILGKTQLKVWVISTEIDIAIPVIRNFFWKNHCDSSRVDSCTWHYYDDEKRSVSQELCELLRKNHVEDFIVSKVLK